MCIGVLVKQGQTQDTTSGHSGSFLPDVRVAQIRFRAEGGQGINTAIYWGGGGREEQNVGMSGVGDGVGGRRGELVGAQGV